MTISVRKAALAGIAMVGATVLLAGCGSAPSASKTTSASSKYLPCMVSDSGGFNDKSFNELGLDGLKEAASGLGTSYKAVESADQTVYSSNITSLLNQKCNLIITVGYLLSDATKTAAKANPKTDFATIDDNEIDAANVRPITFETDEAAFLGGYAAASYSKTGVVGTLGGQQIPTVTIFMDGFADGVAYYNQQKHKNVKLVGWNEKTQKGVFTGGFEAGTAAKQAAQTLLDQDADVIMPVGGPIYQSAAQAIKDSKKGQVLIGVDSDTYQTDPQNASLFLTSVEKGIAPATKAVVEDAAKGNFTKTPYIGTLKNDGVGLAPFHDYKDKISSTLPAELNTIKAGIIDGSIKVESPAALTK
ncbi:BMP family lipoprotein [Frondihabitans australicus]|uniref:Nucleoside-binding protein n=1 Tax=Frondihabitans australicus TaxID=386892 RepID=A0A495IDW1_9MICO|nr:BMP family ABC transporter substrate-binding protein [Frondihabitans australicus]RKR73196.1 nucleoside-binding protein [Frondihabitans australicus]